MRNLCFHMVLLSTYFQFETESKFSRLETTHISSNADQNVQFGYFIIVSICCTHIPGEKIVLSLGITFWPEILCTLSSLSEQRVRKKCLQLTDFKIGLIIGWSPISTRWPSNIGLVPSPRPTREILSFLGKMDSNHFIEDQ